MRLKKRFFNVMLFLILLILEVLIAMYVHDNFVRPYIGDVLVVIVLYFAVRSVWPAGLTHLPLILFLFAACVEILQYFNLPQLLGLQDYTFFRILLGSTFDVKDILCYGVGCIFLFLYQKWIGAVNGA